MKKRLLRLMVLLLMTSLTGYAQDKTVSGIVKAKDGSGMPGVNIIIKGTANGTTSDADGGFHISVPSSESVLVFTFIGHTTQEIVVGDQTTVDVTLAEDATQLGEVVVTALGIAKERKALGYSVTEVQGESLTQARETNVLNSLVGKVAGLNVSSIAGGPGSSSNVTIRGVSSLGQSNQPLYVVNGVPMESAPNGNTGSQWDNAPDLGDAIGNLNPDDIESISVLKGAAASALYGYRAKAGVIMITTKSGKSSGIEFNSNYVGEKIIDQTDWQYVYGQGANNIKPTTQLGAAQVGQSSWGGKLDGTSVVQYDGVSRPYSAQKNNMENFYRTGSSWTNTLSFNKSFENGSIRLAASKLANNSVVPNSGLKRETFNFAGKFNPTKQLSIDARANYISEQVKNRAMLSDGAGNANFNVAFMPTSIDVNTMKKGVNDDGSEFVYNTGNAYATNPWFAANNFINNTKRERLISSLTARYTFDKGYFIQGRIGHDGYTDRYTGVLPSGTAYYAKGKLNEVSTTFADLNADVLVGKTFNVTKDFKVTPNVGASYRRTKSEIFTNGGSDFIAFGVYNIKNISNKSVDYKVSDAETQSVYGTLELEYKGFLYLTGSTRSDWFSSLATPGKNNKLNIVYPAVSGSFVFSELMQSNILTTGKIRTGYAVVGQATNPYQTQLTYSLSSASLNGAPLGNVTNDGIPNSSLKPSSASEFEIGTELGFLQNRIKLDLTYYDKKSKNEILNVPASNTSGYTSSVLNVGAIQNKGFEALLTAVPFQSGSFKWTTSLNGSINHNKVLSLADGQNNMLLGTSRSGVGFIKNVVGESAAQVMAYDYKYDADGKIMLLDTGIPVRGDLKSYGSAYHKVIGGWNNEFDYKGVSFSFLIDGKFGGKIFSATDYYGYIFGLHKATLVNREGEWGNDGNKINSSTYYAGVANNVSKTFVQDASFVKLRQIMLGYNLPARLFHNKIQGVKISLVARNLLVLMKKTDNFDPEASYTTAAPGLELGGVPLVRTYGFNLNVKL